MSKKQKILPTFPLENLPEGWFAKAQIIRLYELATLTPGPILEIGPWVGRSTCVVAYALKERSTPVEFHTVDYGLSSEEEWKAMFGSDVRSKPNPDRYLRHINQPGGTITSLERNLSERGLRDYVQIHRGDFHEVAPKGPFSLIFCDATHNRREINRNIPALLERLSPGGTLACDDINDDLFEYLTSQFTFEDIHRAEFLFSGTPV